MLPWRERAQAFGLRAVIALPLRLEGETAGVFALYAAQTGVFDRQEVRLLEELAADTVLGLEHLAKAQQLSRLANYDVLTGLPNRTLFEDRLGQALARARYTQRPLAVLIVRLEKLRQVWSVFGRHVGDALLRQTGRYLEEALRPGDTVARLSSANFGVLLADLAHAQDVALVTKRMLDCLPEELVIEGEKLFPSLRAWGWRSSRWTARTARRCCAMRSSRSIRPSRSPRPRGGSSSIRTGSARRPRNACASNRRCMRHWSAASSPYTINPSWSSRAGASSGSRRSRAGLTPPMGCRPPERLHSARRVERAHPAARRLGDRDRLPPGDALGAGRIRRVARGRQRLCMAVA